LKEQRNLKTQMMTEAKSKGKPYCKACRAHKDFLLGTVFNSSAGQLVRVLVTSFGKHGDFERCFLDSFFNLLEKEKRKTLVMAIKKMVVWEAAFE
jgi:hypothetical protein